MEAEERLDGVTARVGSDPGLMRGEVDAERFGASARLCGCSTRPVVPDVSDDGRVQGALGLSGCLKAFIPYRQRADIGSGFGA
jgi:hypothetical protein